MLYQGKEFTPIKGHDGYFICRETTEVLSVVDRTNTVKGTYKILKQVNNSKKSTCNYYVVSLKQEGKKAKNFFIHRLMAETFIPNPENKPQINHIDGNKLNNNINNLEWVTCAENVRHAIQTGLDKKDSCRIPVYQYDDNWNFIQKFASSRDAFIATGIQDTNINKVCRGERSKAGGYRWSRVKR